MQVVTDSSQAILTAFTSALNLLLTFIPRFLGFLIIILVGWLIASIISRTVIFLLRRIGFDRAANKIGLTTLEQRARVRLDTSAILGRIAYWFVFLIFLVPATDALGLPSVSATLNRLVAYLPNVFVAVLILFLAMLVGSILAEVVSSFSARENASTSTVLAGFARWTVIGFGIILALEQLEIATAIVTVLFTAIVGALALAFGLAFGLGGRETAQRILGRAENSFPQLIAHVSGSPKRSNYPEPPIAETSSNQT